jgi:SM-20-related protein
MGDSSPSEAVPDPFQGLAGRLAEGLLTADWVHLPGALDPGRVAALRAEAEAVPLAPAAIGRGARRAHDPALRSDRTVWLDALDAAAAPALRALEHELDALRVALDRRLLLGLTEVEALLACYPPGAAYARHLDRFADHDARVLSLVLYLNDGWAPEHGGALRLHLADGPRDLLPESGTLVAFLSDCVAHEVLPATRPRWSVAAWFRRRAR